MSEVRTSEYMELVARKLFGISNVPHEEQAKMVNRLAKEVYKLCTEKDQDINVLQDRIKQLEHKINGLHGIIDGQKVIVNELEAELDKYKWKPIDDYARSGEPVIIAYMDCSTISYDVCDYIDDIDGYLSFCTCSDRAEVFEDKILGYMPIPDFKENKDE